MGRAEKRIFRFGLFEADASSGELRKAGMRLRLQEQPFQVLMLMLERPGEVITREEIRKRLWPSDTFIDFDHSLNTNINKIREALNDSAASPRFIETLAKRGYRFLVPVSLGLSDSAQQQSVSSSAESSCAAETFETNESQQGSSSASAFQLTQIEELPAVSPAYVRGLFLLIQVMFLIFYIVALARTSAVQDLLERVSGGHAWTTIAVIVSASIGIPVRLYLLAAVSFDVRSFSRRFLSIFPAVLVLDELWALSPFLLTRQIGVGLALGATAALAYVPFAQRTLVLMRDRSESLKS